MIVLPNNRLINVLTFYRSTETADLEWDEQPIVGWQITDMGDDPPIADPIVPGELYTPSLTETWCYHIMDGPQEAWSFSMSIWFYSFNEAARWAAKIMDKYKAAPS